MPAREFTSFGREMKKRRKCCAANSVLETPRGIRKVKCARSSSGGMPSRGTPRVGMSSKNNMPTRLRRDGMAPDETFFDNSNRRRITTYVDGRGATYVKKRMCALRTILNSMCAHVGPPRDPKSCHIQPFECAH